jgi:uncharacterized protein
MIPESVDIVFLILLFIVALLYSSVGHGGASGYLALMGLFHFTPEAMRPGALMLNVFVSLIAWLQYSRSEKLDVRLFLWLIAGSVPAAFLGARIQLDVDLYKQVLGAILLFQAVRLMISNRPSVQSGKEFNSLVVFLIGASIGLLSGMIGIGGGIILSPLLLILGWTTMRQTALISALFIFVNSLSGLAGLYSIGAQFEPVLYIWIAVAYTGGIAGGWLGSKRFSAVWLQRLLGVVLLIAGIKLIIL